MLKMVRNSPPSLLILGRGYVGSALAEKVPDAKTTRQNIFRLSDRSTWQPNFFKLSPKTTVIWTFPAASNDPEENLAIEFFDKFLAPFQVIVYGSTSSYQVTQPNEWVTEESQLNLSQPRTRTEEALRLRGACILQLAGIFGPARDPARWYKQGLIQAGLSYLNLIHLNDIVSLTLRLIAEPNSEASGNRFNLSNGKPKTHLEIMKALKIKKILPPDFSIPPAVKQDSKRVCNFKIKQLLSLKDDELVDYP